MLSEKRLCSTKIQPAGTQWNSAPVWSLCVNRQLEKVSHTHLQRKLSLRHSEKDDIKVFFLKKNLFCRKLFRQWFQPVPLEDWIPFLAWKVIFWLKYLCDSYLCCFYNNIQIISKKAGERFWTCWCHISQSRLIQQSLMSLWPVLTDISSMTCWEMRWPWSYFVAGGTNLHSSNKITFS